MSLYVELAFPCFCSDSWLCPQFRPSAVIHKQLAAGGRVLIRPTSNQSFPYYRLRYLTYWSFYNCSIFYREQPNNQIKVNSISQTEPFLFCAGTTFSVTNGSSSKPGILSTAEVGFPDPSPEQRLSGWIPPCPRTSGSFWWRSDSWLRTFWGCCSSLHETIFELKPIYTNNPGWEPSN